MSGKLARALVGAFAALLLLAVPARGEFGLHDFKARFVEEGGSPATQAGSHPFAVTTSFSVNTRNDPKFISEENPEGTIPDGEVKDLRFSLPAGLIGSRTAVPQCTTADFLSIVGSEGTCPDASAVGAVRVSVVAPEKEAVEPVYNLVPPPGVAAKFGFIAALIPVTVEVGINDEEPNNITAALVNVPQAAWFYAATMQLWGVPSAHSHDPFRGGCLAHSGGTGEEFVSLGICDTGAAEVPFLTLPRSCTGPLTTSVEAVSWQEPDAEPARGSFEAPGMSGCSKLSFSPELSNTPTSSSAESASGLDLSVDFHDLGINSPHGNAQSEIKQAVVELPAGMTVNPSSASGLAVCSEESYKAESLATLPAAGCPQASKIGEVEVESPLLAEGETLRGSVFLAEQEKNPFGSLIALYMVIKDQGLGVLVKRPLKVEPNEGSGADAGRLVTTLEGIPQLPVSRFHFRFKEGARAPLITPPTCGNYATEAQFTPWANPSKPLSTSASFEITSGPNGGPCPSGGVPPFTPHFEAGSVNNNAGAYSTFQMRLTRGDGEQEMTRFDAVLPKGMVAKLAGVSRCPEGAIAIAKAKKGRAELASPSCPASSEIGQTIVGAGVGGILTWVPGNLYLGGPFAGDPLSVIAITPAVAGPFDLGTTVVHEALTVDPETAEVKVDGAHSDPIPHILRGLPVKVKDLRVFTDRPNFTLNPTSCARKEARATLFGSFLDVFSPADDKPANLSARYQAASCASLKFKPKLSLKLKGGTKRGAHPGLTATLTYPPGAGYANTRSAAVTLPHSEFLEQSHIRTVCTRVQFSAHQCPEGSVYGKARAFSPLLDEPLEGPVYLRSSSHKLPDMVIALHGLVDFDLVGRIDSVHARIRNSFDSAPDAPVSKFVLELPAGKKGLLVNSRNLCGYPARARSLFTAQNGKVNEQEPLLSVRCGG